MPRNTTGGSGHKKGKRGNGFRGMKATAAALDMLELIVTREKKGTLKPEERSALLELQVGRITKRLGNGWMDVYCQDGVERRSHIRGLLRRKKGGAFMEVGSIVVVALEEPLDELDSSDDEGFAPLASGASTKGYIVGLFDERAVGLLQKTRINPRVFASTVDEGEEADYFDRSEVAPEELSSKQRKAKRMDDEVDVDRI